MSRRAYAALLLLGTWAMGPMGAPARAEPISQAMSVSLSAPGLLGVGVLFQPAPELTAFVSGGYTYLPLGSTYALAVGNVESGVRWKPFSHGLFFYGSAGYQNLGIRANLKLDSLAPDVGTLPTLLKLENFSLYAGLGWVWMRASGMTISVDAGLQVPLIAGGGLSMQNTGAADAAMVQSLEAAARSPARYFSALVLPRITLIRLTFPL